MCGTVWYSPIVLSSVVYILHCAWLFLVYNPPLHSDHTIRTLERVLYLDWPLSLFGNPFPVVAGSPMTTCFSRLAVHLLLQESVCLFTFVLTHSFDIS